MPNNYPIIVFSKRHKPGTPISFSWLVLSFFCLMMGQSFAANNAPVLNPSIVLSLTATEDSPAPVGAVGALVSSFTGGISDVDGGIKGIAIIASIETSGVWYYSINNGNIWTAIGSVSASNALLLSADANTRLFFKPNTGVTGTLPALLTVRAWDNSVGVGGSRTNITATGGTTAFSTNTDVIDVTVTAVANLGVVVNMNPTYNNYTLPSFSNAVPALTYAYAPYTNLKYRFSITNVTTGVTAPDVIQVSNQVTIPLSIHTYYSTFSIKVSAVINDIVLPFLGNTITVNGPGAPKITLTAASCEARLTSLASIISADIALNPTSYTFRIRYNNSSANPVYYYSTSATRFMGANSFGGYPLQYGSSYKVAVQYKYIHAVTHLETESGYGPECTIYTPSIPLIGLVNPACGSTLASMNTIIAADAGAYAKSYQFRIRRADDTGITPTYYYTIPANNRFLSLNLFQGITMAYNTAYYISVEYAIQERSSLVWSGFGPECRFTTPSGGGFAAKASTQNEEFSVKTYPNPFADSFSIDLKTSSPSDINIKVFDMIGRLIEQRSATADEVASATIGAEYPTGVYNVIISQEDKVKTLRVVKR